MTEPIPPQPEHSAEEQDQQLSETIAFFEQMLQTMPDDRVSLEVLAQAYENAGDAARACAYLMRLADVVVREGDREAARTLHNRLTEYAGEARVAQTLAKLASLMTAAPPGPRQTATAAARTAPAKPELKLFNAAQQASDQGYRRQIVSQELELAWMLHEQRLMNEDQYTTLVNDLADLSGSAVPAPISILHLFHDRQLAGMDQALTLLTEKSGLPLLPLSAFEPQPDACLLLPVDYMVIRGAIPFDVLAHDLLVAVLNPISEPLRRDVAQATGRVCHFFLVQPADFDHAIEKVRKLAPTPAATAAT